MAHGPLFIRGRRDKEVMLPAFSTLEAYQAIHHCNPQVIKQKEPTKGNWNVHTLQGR
jgi:hypothetical protein